MFSPLHKAAGQAVVEQKGDWAIAELQLHLGSWDSCSGAQFHTSASLTSGGHSDHAEEPLVKSGKSGMTERELSGDGEVWVCAA